MSWELLKRNLKPIVIYLNIFGLMPVSVNNSNFKISKFQIIYSVILELINICYYSVKFQFSSVKSLDSVNDFALTSQILSFAMLTSLSHFAFLCRSTTLSKIWFQIFKLSKELSDKRIYKKIYRVVFCEVVVSIFFVIIFNINIFVFQSDIYDSFISIFELLMSNRWYFHLFGIHIFFFNILIFCNEILKLANEELNQISEIDYVIGVMERQKVKENKNISSVVLKFRNVADLCDDANTCFGPAFTVSCSLTLFQLIIGCYYISRGWTLLYLMFLWILSFILNLWIVLFACEIIMAQVIFLIF